MFGRGGDQLDSQRPQAAAIDQQVVLQRTRPVRSEVRLIETTALGVAVSEALTGKKSPEEALNGIVPKVNEIMKRGGYLKA